MFSKTRQKTTRQNEVFELVDEDNLQSIQDLTFKSAIYLNSVKFRKNGQKICQNEVQIFVHFIFLK